MKPASIRIFPDPILRKKTHQVTAFDRSLLKLVAALVRVMKSQPHGIGIAAPQIGVAKSVAVVDVSKRDPKAERLILVNPVILEKREPEARKEGCMSLPDYTAFLKRHRWVRFRFQDFFYFGFIGKIKAIRTRQNINLTDPQFLVDFFK